MPTDLLGRFRRKFWVESNNEEPKPFSFHSPRHCSCACRFYCYQRRDPNEEAIPLARIGRLCRSTCCVLGGKVTVVQLLPGQVWNWLTPELAEKSNVMMRNACPRVFVGSFHSHMLSSATMRLAGEASLDYEAPAHLRGKKLFMEQWIMYGLSSPKSHLVVCPESRHKVR